MPTTQPDLKPNRRGLWLAVAVVVALLALASWVVLRNFDRSSPAALRRAAFDGDQATVRRLITAHPEWIDSVGPTTGLAQMFSGLYDKAMKAVGKPRPSSFGNPEREFREQEGLGGRTPLFYALAGRHPGTATLLLEAGASARSRLPNGYPLVFMATSMGDTNLLAHFEAHGAKLNEREPRFLSSLMHYAATSEMLQFLIGRGQSVNATNRLGATPLHLAAGGGRLDLLQVLATNGAKLTHLTARGHTALDEARYALARNPSSNAAAVVTWLEAFAATNPPPAKPLP